MRLGILRLDDRTLKRFCAKRWVFHDRCHFGVRELEPNNVLLIKPISLNSIYNSCSLLCGVEVCETNKGTLLAWTCSSWENLRSIVVLHFYPNFFVPQVRSENVSYFSRCSINWQTVNLHYIGSMFWYSEHIWPEHFFYLFQECILLSIARTLHLDPSRSFCKICSITSCWIAWAFQTLQQLDQRLRNIIIGWICRLLIWSFESCLVCLRDQIDVV